jgi:hypothetical protein
MADDVRLQSDDSFHFKSSNQSYAIF